MQTSRTEIAQVRNGRHKRRGSGLRTCIVVVSGRVVRAVRSVDRCSVVPACKPVMPRLPKSVMGATSAEELVCLWI